MDTEQETVDIDSEMQKEIQGLLGTSDSMVLDGRKQIRSVTRNMVFSTCVFLFDLGMGIMDLVIGQYVFAVLFLTLAFTMALLIRKNFQIRKSLKASLEDVEATTLLLKTFAGQ